MVNKDNTFCMAKENVYNLLIFLSQHTSDCETGLTYGFVPGITGYVLRLFLLGQNKMKVFTVACCTHFVIMLLHKA
jgi:hypothetical protein